MKKERSLRQNMLFLSLEKVSNGSITIILMPVMIRAMGIEQYGLWAILLGIFSYMQCLDLGLSFSLERYVAYYQGRNDRKTLQQLITTSLTYILILSALACLLSLTGGDFILTLLIKNSSQVLLPHTFALFIPAFTANFLQSIFMSIPRGFQQFNISSKIQIAGKCIFAITLLATLFRWKSVYSPLFAYSAQTLFTTITYAIAAKTIAPDILFCKLGISMHHLRLLIGFGIKIQVSSLSFLVTQYFDKILLSSFFGLAYTGYYEAATKIIYAVRDIPLFLMSVLTPFISRKMAENDTGAIAELYKKTTAQLTIVSMFLMQLLLINQREILSFVLKGEPNSFTLLVFQLLAITGFWHVISGTSTYVSRGMGKTAVEMKTNILTLILNVTFSLLFMRLFSVSGVVYGTALALTVSPFLSYYLTNKLFNISTIRFLAESYIPPLLSTTPALILVLIIRSAFLQQCNPVAVVIIQSSLLLIATHASFILSRNQQYQNLVSLLPFIRK